MNEQTIVDSVVTAMLGKGFRVKTEVANLHRSADICLIDDEGKIWIIECKVSSISRAIVQSRTHKLAADRVFIATVQRKTRDAIREEIAKAGLGLLYVKPDGSVSEPVVEPRRNRPWHLARATLFRRMQEAG
jgi:hypothetical protein